jgi:hypothetical protein
MKKINLFEILVGTDGYNLINKIQDKDCQTDQLRIIEIIIFHLLPSHFHF